MTTIPDAYKKVPYPAEDLRKLWGLRPQRIVLGTKKVSRLSAVLTCAVLLYGNGSFVVWKFAVTDPKMKSVNL